MGPAIEHYQQALMLNPRHRSAHEHLGEVHLALGDPVTAEQHLAHLEGICLIGCEEYDDLKRAIAGSLRGWWLAEACSAGGRIKGTGRNQHWLVPGILAVRSLWPLRVPHMLQRFG